MTHEEAADVLSDMIYGLYPDDDITVDEEKIGAVRLATAALRTTQLDENGLMPCGCGGKAGFHYSVMMRDNDCYVECGICGGHTKVVLSEDKARDAWNTAMGWKGGAE